MTPLPKIIFAGTPTFAASALAAIHDAGITISLVLTQPDRPKGRGMKRQASPVKQLAEKLGIPVAQPTSLKSAEIQALIAAQDADVMVVAAYGLLLPAAVLSLPKQGCLNIHASLLPRWRGAAPIERAIEAGDTQTGVCIMQMDEGLDTGDVISRHVYAIAPTDTSADVHNALMQMGAQAIVADLQHLQTLTRTPQSHEGITYAAKLNKAEALLDWQKPAEVLARQIRAFNPAPGAWTWWQGKPLKIWQAQIVVGSGMPGSILKADAHELIVACGDAALSLHTIQPAGSKAMPAVAFLNGNTITPGQFLGIGQPS
ncbi:methionyl-tRNA formyltransferase [Snodgrassella sp. CFCC 13594]|uniref:methionyl-tRNA formyltransferase n=1 Tax=Snodgrassella sp. CFCC 13594 TaxID=1775559 RepID=UPI0008321EEE|nr:methionyl-tRNA formyltransferase [Snodgrassella sp. CFCC 13594]